MNKNRQLKEAKVAEIKGKLEKVTICYSCRLSRSYC